MKNFYIKSILLMIFHISVFIDSQQIISGEVAHILRTEKTYTTEQALNKAYKTLSVSTTTGDSILSYRNIGDQLEKQADFYEAIKYFKRSADLSLKIKDFDSYGVAMFLSAMSYNQLDMEEQSDRIWDSVKMYKDHIQQYNDFTFQHTIWKLDKQAKYCESALLQKENLRNFDRKHQAVGTISNNEHFAAYKCILAYQLLRCGEKDSFDEAKGLIKEIEKIINKHTSINEFYFAQKYYLCKALIANKEGHSASTLQWYKNAIDNSISHKNYRHLIEIIKLRNTLNIPRSELNYASEYLDIADKKIKESAKISEYLLRKNELLVNKDELMQKKVIAIFSLLIMIIFFSICYHFYHKKLMKRKFEGIIATLENQEINDENFVSEEEITEESGNVKSDVDQIPDTKRMMSEKTETELVKKLNAFEKRKDFTANNFSISTMASLLGTNTKYLKYILITQKNTNFNSYINQLRIQYLVKLLYNEPQYLNYKIQYLSKYIGFSSHSRFAYIFKKELGISPSEFIKNLKALKNQNDVSSGLDEEETDI